MRYIRPVADISTFNRYFHRILHAECYARPFKRRHKLTCVLNATIYTILRKTVRYIRPVGICRRLNAISFAFYTPNAMHAAFSMETCPTERKLRPFTRFWWQTVRYIGPAGDISTLKRYLHRILHAEWYARQFHCRNIKICARNATIYSILMKTVGYIDSVGYISTF